MGEEKIGLLVHRIHSIQDFKFKKEKQEPDNIALNIRPYVSGFQDYNGIRLFYLQEERLTLYPALY